MRQSKIDLVRYRLSRQDAFDTLRRKVHSLRKLVAGDLSPLGLPEQQYEDGPEEQSDFRIDEFYDILVTSVDSGRSNKMLQSVRTLLMQTCFSVPAIDIENLDDMETTLHCQYLKSRLGPRPRGCAAVDQMRLGLADYLVGAVGWDGVAIESGRPVVRNVDALDVSFDTQAKLMTDIRWQSVRVRQPLSYWKSVYGSKPFQRIDGFGGADAFATLEYYYDTEGQGGSHVVWLRTGRGLDDKPVYASASNPFYCELDGATVPYLPYDAQYHLALPSVKFAMSPVEMMLPNQIALWEIERRMRETVQRGAPFYNVEEGALDPKEFAKFMRGDIGAAVRRHKGYGPVTSQPGLEIPATLEAFRRYNVEELTANGGVNPYATGSRVEGIDFASEVNAIQGNSGLVAGMIAKDHTAHWERVVSKYLMAAALYDDAPFTAMIDGVRMEFDEATPISEFIEPAAYISIREDATQFVPKDRMILDSARNLEIALRMAPFAPNAPLEAYKAFLKATGETNVAKWLEAPGESQLQSGRVSEQAQAQAQIVR